MKKAIALIGMIALLASSLTVVAAENTGAESTAAENTAVTVTTPDDVLSVEVSKDEWKEKEDTDHWFEITDGKNSIVIDHLANGESLPDVKMAAEENEEICQTFISTKNEVFIVTGLADSREAFEDVIKTVGTIRILKYDTKTAIQKETQNAQTTQSGINAINATYYVTTDELNVRSAPSSDSEVIGSLYKGEPVHLWLVYINYISRSTSHLRLDSCKESHSLRHTAQHMNLPQQPEKSHRTLQTPFFL